MDFLFDERLTRLRDSGRDVGRRWVEPTVATRDHRASWHPELFRALARVGLTGLVLPASYGGRALSVLEAVVLLEGLGEGGTDTGLAFAIGVHGVLCGAPIATLGTVTQRERYLPNIATGELLAGLALSEVDGGATTAGDGVTAVRTTEGWQLTGSRPNVVNAPFADLFLVTAGTGAGGRTAFLLDRGTPGLDVMPDPEPVALRTAPSGELVLTGCQVTHDAVLGSPGAANSELVPLLAALDRTCLLAPWLGILRVAVVQTLARVAEQPLFGGPLARSQAVRMAVVDLQTRAELGAALLYRAAWQLGRLNRAPRLDAATAKLFLVGAIRDTLATAAGFTGIAPPPVLERAGRDVLALAGRGGADEVLRSVVAGALLELG